MPPQTPDPASDPVRRPGPIPGATHREPAREEQSPRYAYADEEADEDDVNAHHLHVPGPDDYLEDPVLPPRMALAPPHMQRPDAPANPVPPGFQYPAGSTFVPQRKRRRGTATKTPLNPELLDVGLPAGFGMKGEHYQKHRGRRDAIIVTFLLLAVLVVVVVMFLPDEYFGRKREPVTDAPLTNAGGSDLPRQNDLTAADRRDRDASTVVDPDSPEERKKIVDKALEEARAASANMDRELDALRSGIVPAVPAPVATPRALPSTVIPLDPLDPTADLALPPDPPGLGDTPPPKPPKKSQSEVEAEVDRLTREAFRKASEQAAQEQAAQPVPRATLP